MRDIHIIKATIVVPAKIADVWSVWTTSKGAETFLAPECRIELKVGGDYEIYFSPDAFQGEKGAEGTRILAFDVPNFLSFSWNNPPSIPDIRWQYTLVSIYLDQVSPDQTQISLFQTGWGVGEDWDKAREYFTRAWKEIVLPRLLKRFEKGPIDWSLV